MQIIDLILTESCNCGLLIPVTMQNLDFNIVAKWKKVVNEDNHGETSFILISGMRVRYYLLQTDLSVISRWLFIAFVGRLIVFWEGHVLLLRIDRLRPNEGDVQQQRQEHLKEKANNKKIWHLVYRQKKEIYNIYIYTRYTTFTAHR